jgi:putative ABC transport system permease protein
MLKLIGARNSVIVKMIGQQAGLIGLAGFALALVMSMVIFPFFPRRIIIDIADAGMLAAVLAAICAIASGVGIARALKVNAREVLS